MNGYPAKYLHTKVKSPRIQVGGVLLALVSSFSFKINAETDTIHFAIGEYPPLVTKSREDLGIATKFVREACKLANLKPKFDFFSWNKAGHVVQNGNYTASFPWRKNEERLERFLFSEYTTSQSMTAVFYFENTLTQALPSWVKYNQLSHHGLVGINGYWYQEELEALGSQAYLARDAQHAWSILKAGRMKLLADTYLTGITESESFLTAEDFKRVKFKLSSTPPIPGYIIYSKAHPDALRFKERLDKAILDLHSKGFFDELFSPKIHKP